MNTLTKAIHAPVGAKPNKRPISTFLEDEADWLIGHSVESESFDQIQVSDKSHPCSSASVCLTELLNNLDGRSGLASISCQINACGNQSSSPDSRITSASYFDASLNSFGGDLLASIVAFCSIDQFDQDCDVIKRIDYYGRLISEPLFDWPVARLPFQKPVIRTPEPKSVEVQYFRQLSDHIFSMRHLEVDDDSRLVFKNIDESKMTAFWRCFGQLSLKLMFKQLSVNKVKASIHNNYKAGIHKSPFLSQLQARVIEVIRITTSDLDLYSNQLALLLAILLLYECLLSTALKHRSVVDSIHQYFETECLLAIEFRKRLWLTYVSEV